ncbi:MAG: hypothetical protein BMS9Abin25_0464 [Gammaproteobacteria bacterium]|nr:MAG: hypothetical protein BMS9Abin25_0464 [Gammaproteobacteria bacterium]
MGHKVNLNGKLVSVNVSQTAQKRLKKMATPLLIEVELYFSCLIKKACHFSETEDAENYAKVMDGLYIHFRATMTKRCSIEEFEKDRTADFPIVNLKPYIPKWVRLDFTGVEWAGEFGYADADATGT